MDLDEARANTGGLVTYDPGGMQRPEWGLLLRVSIRGTVFVRYAGDPHPKATPVERLTLEAPPVDPFPSPAGGCTCGDASQDAGGGYVEPLLDLDPACPVHSDYLYDPRRGAWIPRGDL